MGHLYHGYVSHNQRVYIQHISNTKILDWNQQTQKTADFGWLRILPLHQRSLKDSWCDFVAARSKIMRVMKEKYVTFTGCWGLSIMGNILGNIMGTIKLRGIIVSIEWEYHGNISHKSSWLLKPQANSILPCLIGIGFAAASRVYLKIGMGLFRLCPKMTMFNREKPWLDTQDVF